MDEIARVGTDADMLPWQLPGPIVLILARPDAMGSKSTKAPKVGLV